MQPLFPGIYENEVNMLSNCYIPTLVEGVVIFITLTLPLEGQSVIVSQVGPVVGEVNGQGSWSIEQQQLCLSWRLHPIHSFVEKTWLPVTSKEWGRECHPAGLGRSGRHQTLSNILSTSGPESSVQNPSEPGMNPQPNSPVEKFM